MLFLTDQTTKMADSWRLSQKDPSIMSVVDIECIQQYTHFKANISLSRIMVIDGSRNI